MIILKGLLKCSNNFYSQKFIILNLNLFLLKLNNEKTVTHVHKIVNKLGSDIQIINTKKSQSLNNDISKLEKDFAYLLSPSKLPNAYN